MLRTPLAHIAAPLCRPSPEACAEDYAWFRERLADPGLFDHAVGVKVSGAVLLAVPAGGCWRGGYLSVGSVADAVRVRAALRGWPGFPRVRLGLSVHRDTCHTVHWGPRQPWDDAERGMYFGYVPSAIDTFVRRRSIPDRPAAQVEHDSDQGDGRSWSQDPLKSTLRDLSGCLVVVLLGVLITLLVSAAKVNATGPTPTPPPPPMWAPTFPASPSPLTSRRWAAR
ncbi:DUF6302 family protein [Streptomyces halstedii]|uniref:DUF6302 family protein n=1 Tax=Streptomyces halstedii TaxID=1944 RepID=UPI0019414C02|nr:DUF6302 family protein [Streptomyces halstedii]